MWPASNISTTVAAAMAAVEAAAAASTAAEVRVACGDAGFLRRRYHARVVAACSVAVAAAAAVAVAALAATDDARGRTRARLTPRT